MARNHLKMNDILSWESFQLNVPLITFVTSQVLANYRGINWCFTGYREDESYLNFADIDIRYCDYSGIVTMQFMIAFPTANLGIVTFID